MKRLFLVIPLLYSCMTYTAAKPPRWYDVLEDVYPDDRYIAQIGYGKTRQAAEADAAARISHFF